MRRLHEGQLLQIALQVSQLGDLLKQWLIQVGAELPMEAVVNKYLASCHKIGTLRMHPLLYWLNSYFCWHCGSIRRWYKVNQICPSGFVSFSRSDDVTSTHLPASLYFTVSPVWCIRSYAYTPRGCAHTPLSPVLVQGVLWRTFTRMQGISICEHKPVICHDSHLLQLSAKRATKVNSSSFPVFLLTLCFS